MAPSIHCSMNTFCSWSLLLIFEYVFFFTIAEVCMMSVDAFTQFVLWLQVTFLSQWLHFLLFYSLMFLFNNQMKN